MPAKKIKVKGTDILKKTELKPLQIAPPIKGLTPNPNLPTHHADIISVLASTDGMALLSFYSRTPGMHVEECRVSFTFTLAKKIIELLSQQINQHTQNQAQTIKDEQIKRS